MVMMMTNLLKTTTTSALQIKLKFNTEGVKYMMRGGRLSMGYRELVSIRSDNDDDDDEA